MLEETEKREKAEKEKSNCESRMTFGAISESPEKKLLIKYIKDTAAEAEKFKKKLMETKRVVAQMTLMSRSLDRKLNELMKMANELL